MAKLTDARNAVWLAVENYADTTGYFKYKERLDDKTPAIATGFPSLSQLPYIKIFPAETKDSPIDYAQNQIDYRLNLEVWLPTWNLAAAEDIWEKVMQAVYRYVDTANGHTVPEVKRVTGFHPSFSTQTNWVFRRFEDGKIQALSFTWSVALKMKINLNPNVAQA